MWFRMKWTRSTLFSHSHCSKLLSWTDVGLGPLICMLNDAGNYPNTHYSGHKEVSLCFALSCFCYVTTVFQFSLITMKVNMTQYLCCCFYFPLKLPEKLNENPKKYNAHAGVKSHNLTGNIILGECGLLNSETWSHYEFGPRLSNIGCLGSHCWPRVETTLIRIHTAFRSGLDVGSSPCPRGFWQNVITPLNTWTLKMFQCEPLYNVFSCRSPLKYGYQKGMFHFPDS